MRIGFVRLIDAAPLIIAVEKGFFSAAGVAVSLHREIGWMNIRDKLTYGRLDASHALLGMAIMSQLGRADFVEPLVGVMALGAGGNSLVVSRHLAEMGITSGAALGNLVRTGLFGRKIVCAHVSSFSMHHYLLREWLAEGGMNPDKDVQLCQLTPMQVAEHLERGYVDLFCAGEPWGTLAQERQWGSVIAASTDILPAHPEKLLAVRQQYAQDHGEEISRVVQAVLQACRYCRNPGNIHEMAAILARPEYLNESAELLERCLRADSAGTGSAAAQRARSKDWFVRSWHDTHTFPSCTHVVWMLRQMIRWGELAADAPVRQIAQRSVRSDFYRKEAERLNIPLPLTDFPDMPLRRGILTMTPPVGGSDAGPPGRKMDSFLQSPPSPPPAGPTAVSGHRNHGLRPHRPAGNIGGEGPQAAGAGRTKIKGLRAPFRTGAGYAAIGIRRGISAVTE